MKIRTNYDKEKGLFAFPVLAIAYGYEEKELTIVFYVCLLGICNRILL